MPAPPLPRRLRTSRLRAPALGLRPPLRRPRTQHRARRAATLPAEPATAWHRLDPLTRLSLSAATLLTVVAAGGICVPLLVAIPAVLLPAAVAGILPRLLRTTILLALPLAVAALLVNVLFTPGDNEAVTLGPLGISDEGLRLGLEMSVRIVVMAGAVTLFSLTTRPAELVASLAAHGVPARLAFVIHNAASAVPRLAERAREVAEVQQARGLDSGDSLMARLRGIGALVGPTVAGAVAEAEVRTLALEVRAFTRPGRHTALRPSLDGPWQRLARWFMAAAVVLLVLARVAGWSPPC